MRRVAQRLLELCGEHVSDDGLKKSIFQFAEMRCCWSSGGWTSMLLGPQREEDMVVKESDEDFKTALLAAATITNDVDFVKHQLSHMQDSFRLLSDKRIPEDNR